MAKKPSDGTRSSGTRRRIENRPSAPLVVLGHGSGSVVRYAAVTVAPATGRPSGATTRPLISTVSTGLRAAGFSRSVSATAVFGFIAGLASSGRDPPPAITPAVARARAASTAAAVNLILVMSISLSRAWVNTTTPDDAEPPVAAATVDRINTGGTAAEASLAGQDGSHRPAPRNPRRVSRSLSRCRACASRQRSVGTVQRSCSAACS